MTLLLKIYFFQAILVYGKTFMSNCIAYELLKKGKTVLYQTAPVLLESVIDYKMSKDKNASQNIYKSVLETDLLIIDDLGTESLNTMIFLKITKNVLAQGLQDIMIFIIFSEMI